MRSIKVILSFCLISLSGCFWSHTEKTVVEEGRPVVIDEYGHGKVVRETTAIDSNGEPYHTTVERRHDP